MPNWCQNHLVLSHEDPSQIKRAYDALQRGEFLQEFVPMPEGEEDWYSWHVNHWGTKWDVGTSEGGIVEISDDGKSLTASFDSAWSPPIAALDSMYTNDGFSATLMYSEEGVGYAGIWEDGGDECYDTSDMTAAEIREELPPELDDMFGISDWRQQDEDEREAEENG